MASSSPAFSDVNQAEEEQADEEAHSATDGAVITEEELEAFGMVKTILAGAIEESRLSLHDTQNYCNVIVDGKRRNYTICRFDFEGRVKYLDTADSDGNFTKNPLASLSSIGNYAEELRARAMALA